MFPVGAVRAQQGTGASPGKPPGLRVSTEGTVIASLGGVARADIVERRSGLRRSRTSRIFLGFNFTFFPQFLLGVQGMPRRYHAYPPKFQELHMLSSAGAVVLALGYLLPLGYLSWSLWRGPRAGANPFGALGLEWQTASPPPTHNFERPPVVPEKVYDYDPRQPDGAPGTSPAGGT